MTRSRIGLSKYVLLDWFLTVVSVFSLNMVFVETAVALPFEGEVSETNLEIEDEPEIVDGSFFVDLCDIRNPWFEDSVRFKVTCWGFETFEHDVNPVLEVSDLVHQETLSDMNSAECSVDFPEGWWVNFKQRPIDNLDVPANMDAKERVESWWPEVRQAICDLGTPYGGARRVFRVMYCESGGFEKPPRNGTGNGLFQFNNQFGTWRKATALAGLPEYGNDIYNAEEGWISIRAAIALAIDHYPKFANRYPDGWHDWGRNEPGNYWSWSCWRD